MKSTLAWSEYCKSMTVSILEVCQNTPVMGGTGALTKSLGQALPDWKFRAVLARGGWHRLGRVINAEGMQIAEDLEDWAQNELEACDGDLLEMAESLQEKYPGQTLFATRYVGQTHYLVAPTGDGPADFLQLEVEDLQEMVGPALFAKDTPQTLEDLIDPAVAINTLKPIGSAKYAFRRVQHMGSFLDRMRAQKPEPSPIHRMLEDWHSSSAGMTSAYYNHWVLATREHLDRYHQPLFRAQPIEVFQGPLPDFTASTGQSGLGLNESLSAFDRALGYPMAWYFHMITSRAIPHWVAQSVVEDSLAGFAYLPARDLAIVRNWLHQPYAV